MQILKIRRHCKIITVPPPHLVQNTHFLFYVHFVLGAVMARICGPDHKNIGKYVR